MDFFDSPLFWIVLIWWVLSTFMGAKARKRRAMQRLSEQEVELPTMPEPEETRFELEGTGEETQPEGIKREEELPVRPLPLTRANKDRTDAGPPRRAPLPRPPLEQLARSLGIPKEFIPAGVITSQDEPAAEAEEGTAEPVGPPEKRMKEAGPSVPVPDALYQVEDRQTAIETSGGIARLYESVLPSLTPLQQAIVLKEILDRPRAFRRDIR